MLQATQPAKRKGTLCTASRTAICRNLVAATSAEVAETRALNTSKRIILQLDVTMTLDKQSRCQISEQTLNFMSGQSKIAQYMP